MVIAWFRPNQSVAAVDYTRYLIDVLGHRHRVDLFDARRAHDFLWMHRSSPYDVCIYELDNTAGHQFVWPYLLHYPGVTMLRRSSLVEARTMTLSQQGRTEHLLAELAWDRAGDMLAAPMAASKLVVVSSMAAADAIRSDYDSSRIRYVPAGVPSIGAARHNNSDEVSVGYVNTDARRRQVIERAAERARDAGVRVKTVIDENARRVLDQADAVLDLCLPAAGAPLTLALAGMAASRPVVVFDAAETADWPSLDPQTWQQRGARSALSPMCISIDPRDEEHSLMLTLKRLASDAELLRQVGAAGHDYWRAHATVEHMVAAFEAVLQESITMAPPRPSDLLPHLSADGTEKARAILAELGISASDAGLDGNRIRG
jgi:hypothetical protein